MARLSPKMKMMLQELRKNFCNVTEACEIVGIGRTTHYNYLENEQYHTQYEAIQESLLDRAESLLHDQMEVDPKQVQFFLKTKGKKRGYSEKMEIEHSGGVNNILTLDDFYKDLNNEDEQES